MTTTPKPRGFAALSPERRTAIARLGGAAVPAHKRPYAVNRDLAATAGAKGGSAPGVKGPRK
jgi:general stress protein YciG